MEIIYRYGDVCDAEELIIAHGCNAQGVMGSGVALFIKNKWPDAYKVYNDAYKTNGLELGQVVYYISPFDDVVIANCITQDFYGYNGNMYVDYDAIRASLRDVNAFAEELGCKAVALPQIGAGRGGGDWNVITEIIESVFVNVQPVVYLYKE